ncbi:hypothetical protein AVEN_210190-1 [Araneus ventricosus]|uniref:Uncharacterized protein n=1 Tax=Araneus ventricosus TaxID=182803 RepID=A0A4Y2USZ1_ARAVE|nr:hypothetical protein AVEN_210190-1 [Araneus ventricosus]
MQMHFAFYREMRSTLTQWEGRISKVISTYCFNTLRRMEAGFENVRKLLQPEGEAAFLIKLHGPFDNLLETLYLNQEWSPYLASFCEVFPPDSIRNMTEKDFQTMAESAGFEVVGCKETVRVYDYDSEDEYTNAHDSNGKSSGAKIQTNRVLQTFPASGITLVPTVTDHDKLSVSYTLKSAGSRFLGGSTNGGVAVLAIFPTTTRASWGGIGTWAGDGHFVINHNTRVIIAAIGSFSNPLA